MSVSSLLWWSTGTNLFSFWCSWRWLVISFKGFKSDVSLKSHVQGPMVIRTNMEVLPKSAIHDLGSSGELAKCGFHVDKTNIQISCLHQGPRHRLLQHLWSHLQRHPRVLHILEIFMQRQALIWIFEVLSFLYQRLTRVLNCMGFIFRELIFLVTFLACILSLESYLCIYMILRQAKYPDFEVRLVPARADVHWVGTWQPAGEEHGVVGDPPPSHGALVLVNPPVPYHFRATSVLLRLATDIFFLRTRALIFWIGRSILLCLACFVSLLLLSEIIFLILSHVY
jgi:hypothetical protein